MTIAPERSDTPKVDLGITDSMPLVAKGLNAAFDADTIMLRRLGALLTDGRITLRRRTLSIAPYIGHSAQQMKILHGMRTNPAVAREIRAVAEFHTATRYNPLAGFLTQFPASSRPALFGSIRDEVTAIELKADQEDRVVEVLVTNARTLHEYGLRAFKLNFAQIQAVAAWMRENEQDLPKHVAQMPQARKGDTAAEAARYAALVTFFDNFPEKMRDLLVAKARPELTRICFQALPTGDVVLLVSSK